jgi:hypothetical protein
MFLSDGSVVGVQILAGACDKSQQPLGGLLAGKPAGPKGWIWAGRRFDTLAPSYASRNAMPRQGSPPLMTQGPGNNIRTVSATLGSPTLITFACLRAFQQSRAGPAVPSAVALRKSAARSNKEIAKDLLLIK